MPFQEKKLRDVCLKHRLLCWEFDFGSIIILSACGMNETFFFSINFKKIYLTFRMWNKLTFLWNKLTILWNDLTIDWNDLT